MLKIFRNSKLKLCSWFPDSTLIMKVKVTPSRLTLCDPMDCNLPGSPVHGILQARILEWVAVPFSGGSSQPRDRTQVSCIAGRFFTIWATREALVWLYSLNKIISLEIKDFNAYI